MQNWSKFQAVNLHFTLQTPSSQITSIKDALTSNELNTIRVSIIDIRPSEQFTKEGITKTSTFILIGDQSGTTYLIGIDLPLETIEVEKTYDITKIRKKNFNSSIFLSTTVDTSISLSAIVILII